MDPIENNLTNGVSVQVFHWDEAQPGNKGNLIYGVYSTGESEDYVYTDWITGYLGLLAIENHTSDIFRRGKNTGVAYIKNVGGEGMQTHIPEYPVIIEFNVRNATFKEVKIPGVGTFTPKELLEKNSLRLNVKVFKKDASIEEYAFSSDGGDNEDGIYGLADKISAKIGDSVVFSIADRGKRPIFKGLPKIWLSAAMAQRRFMCTPDYEPNQVEPWDPFIAQTHYRMINSYPDNFQSKSNDFLDEDEPQYKWSWIAQRRTDPTKTVYKQDVYYPKTKTFQKGSNTWIQRESQSIGWAKEMLNYWEQNNNDFNYSGSASYLSAFDNDEYLYIGSKEKNSKNEDWSGEGITSIKTFTDNNKKDNWQHMWPSETDDWGNTYPIEWDSRGYPSRGVILNDLVTAYQKVKAPETYDEDYYYNGYEIEDYNTFFTVSDGLEMPVSRAPDDTMPLAYENGMWFNAKNSEGNNTHPGEVTISAGDQTISFRLETTSPQDTDSGFYGSLKGTQYPLGFGNESTYILTGVKDEDKFNYIIKLLEGQDGKGTPIVTKSFKFGGGEGYEPLEYNSVNKTLSATFKVYSGASFFVAYYDAGYGEVPIAGRAPMIMDPVTSLTIPGGNPYPYSDESLLPTGIVAPCEDKSWYSTFNPNCYSAFGYDKFVDDLVELNEGQGERPLETQNELRRNQDTGRGFTEQYGSAYIKPYIREYVLRQGEKAKFSCMDAGRKMESFWDIGQDPYLSWRELARRMPVDTIAKNLTYKLYKIENGNIAFIEEQTTRHYEYQFDDIGDYELRANFTDFFNLETVSPATLKIKVTDLPANANDATKFNEHIKRGSFKIRKLDPDEKAILETFNIGEDDLDNFLVADVDYILSEYAYGSGPRATNYQHRFGDQNDFNDQYAWYTVDNEGVETFIDNPEFVNNFINAFIPEDHWPTNWGNSWLRHTSSNYFPKEDIDKDSVENDNTSVAYYTLMNKLFISTEETQSELGFLRWHPWIAPTPTHGDKFNRWIKTSMDLHDFFNNGKGVFSGNAYVDIENVTNASDYLVSSAGYGSYASTPEENEMNSHLTDDIKNKIKMYHDLKNGRMVLFNKADHEKIVLYNKNPGYQSDKYGFDNSVYPEDIYIDAQTIEYLDTNVNRLSGIPILTFDSAEYGTTEFNTEYLISHNNNVHVSSNIVHNGFDRYLKILAKNNNPGGNEVINIKISLYGTLNDGENIPNEISSTITGIRLNRIYKESPVIKYLAKNKDDINIPSTKISPPNDDDDNWQTRIFKPAEGYTYDDLKYFVIQIKLSPGATAEFYLDDVYLENGSSTAWTLADYDSDRNGVTAETDDEEFLDWLQRTAIRYFLWNYREVNVKGNIGAVVLESATDVDKVTPSGIGFGIAATILAAEKGMITDFVAQDRVQKMTTWLANLNPNDGEDGWHGVPWHYLNKDYNGGSVFGEGYGEVSTIDWAICTAALRVARQKYKTVNTTIKNNVDALLGDTKWGKFMVFSYSDPTKHHITDYRLSMDCDPKTGDPNNGNFWGLAFSEETELVYGEALAAMYEFYEEGSNVSDYVFEDDLQFIERTKKDCFFPSWFGAGFTYNWYQLWAGNDDDDAFNGKSIYNDNSIKAYTHDYNTAMTLFGKPYMGFTAVSCVNEIYDDGWIDHNRYVSNQGSNKHLTDDDEEVIQVAPAPYGAALALPFTKNNAVEALREYVNLGFYNQYLGLPDNVQLTNLKGLAPIPSWKQIELNIGPMALAIDQLNDETISSLYLGDYNASESVFEMLNNFADEVCSDSGKSIKPKKEDLETTENDNALVNSAVKLYPNPVSDELNLWFSVNKSGSYQVMIVNLLGEVVLDKKLNLNEGINEVQLTNNIRSVCKSSGLYLIGVKGLELQKIMKLVVE
ncbi:hypothetical protein GCM10023311_09950 [Flaviramulus aquimarinus]|uniref:Secretion system C-terminal sorting domain-containing protein n=2 Tax=Flaviramulus aquimarinus TaxID=1170456 RepID=A0ABP9EV04_9FLAO